MPPDDPRRLFLSYGRADASGFADRLAHDLRHHDLAPHPHYEPFVDRADLKAGAAWTEQLVAALGGVDALLAVMTPHSVRTRRDGHHDDDSVCLDEISYARFAAKKPIVPLMLSPCEPPFEIFRLDYVDFTSWRDEPAYRRSLLRLLDGIAAALAGEVRYRRWHDRLQPWDFDAFLRSKRRTFTGRTRLFEEIHRLADDDATPAVLLVGEPGLGKSAIVAELVHRNPEGRVIAYHCCQANVPETLRPGTFVRSIAGMIASRHPAYEALLDEPAYRDLLTRSASERDPRSALEQGVLAALERTGPPPAGAGRLLVVDALDEALLRRPSRGEPGDDTTIVDLLSQAVDRLPSWLSVVATSRDEQDVLDRLAGIRPRILRADDHDNVRDLEDYVRRRLGRAPLADRLPSSGIAADDVVAALSTAARGNFLYAQQALDAVESGTIGIDAIGTLPPTLEQQFAQFFQRQYDDATWTRVRPLLEVLVAAQEPIQESDLSIGTGLEADTALPQARAAVAQYLRATDDDPPRYEIYHRSLTEWLTSRHNRGKRFGLRAAAGHRRLADGLLARYRADRLRLSAYMLAHLATHVAEAANDAKSEERVALQEALAAFVLDPAVHQQRVDDPIGAHRSIVLALDTVAAGPAAASAVAALELALGLSAFRRTRLNASRLFTLAAAGDLRGFERELQLYPADHQWTAAARMLAAWVAREHAPAAADALRRDPLSRTGTVLDERVDALFEARPATFPPLDEDVNEENVIEIFRHIGGTDDEPVNPSMLWTQSEPPPPDQQPDAEGVRYLAEFHAPTLVAFAQKLPEEGTARVREYVALNAANAYRVYRNGSLWQTLIAVARHRDLDQVREMAPPIVEAALAGGDRDFTGALDLTLLALRAAADPGQRAVLDGAEEALLREVDALAPQRGKSDSWGGYRRSVGALAEAKHWLLAENARPLLEVGIALPRGYAGFHAPAALAFAESLAITGAPEDDVGRALAEARVAAQNVQDLVFCARTVSRVDALRAWWDDVPTEPVGLAEVVQRFATQPRAAEFAARHHIGETYADRSEEHITSLLPGWLRDARSLDALARAYQWPLRHFVTANPEIEDPTAALAEGARVRVPDARWQPMLASFFSARLLVTPGLTDDERARLILSLVPRAATDRTALATVLSRLLLVLRPAEPKTWQRIEQALSRYAADTTVRGGTAGPEPVA